MSDSEIVYASEDERMSFLNILCDRPGDIAGKEDHTRHTAAAQLMAERAEEVGLDTSTIKGKLEYASNVYMIFCDLTELSWTILRGEPLERAKYLKYMGALYRSMPGAYQPDSYLARHFPERAASIQEAVNYKPPYPKPDTPSLYEGLGLIDGARTRRSQSSALSRANPDTRRKRPRAKGD